MSDEVHLERLQLFCRLCEFKVEGLNRSCRLVSGEVKAVYGEDLSNDNEAIHSGNICNSCYQKLKRGKDLKVKWNKKKLGPFKIPAGLPSKVPAGIICGQPEENCKVCSLEVPLDQSAFLVPIILPSPSKIVRLDPLPVLSPSDKGKRGRSQSSDSAMKARKSLHVKVSESPLQTQGETDIKKFYVSETSYDLDRCQEPHIGEVFLCTLCSCVPKQLFWTKTCQHMFCRDCIINYRRATKSAKCPFEGCGCVNTEDDIVPVTGSLKLIHQSLTMRCGVGSCKFTCTVSVLDDHMRICNNRGSYAGKVSLRDMRRDRMIDRVSDIKENVIKMCEESKLGVIDTLFCLLKENLVNDENSLSKNVDVLYKHYNDGIHETADFLPLLPSSLRSAALKSYANLTVQQYKKIEEFENKEGVANPNNLASYKRMLKSEKDVDIGNVDYNLVNKENPSVIKVHTAKTEDPSIPISEDVGCLPPGHINIPVDGARVSISDSIAHRLKSIYKDIVASCSLLYPNLWLPDYVLRVHVKIGWDGTLGKSYNERNNEREECDHWLAGCMGIVHVDLEYGNGKRSVLKSLTVSFQRIQLVCTRGKKRTDLHCPI